MTPAAQAISTEHSSRRRTPRDETTLCQTQSDSRDSESTESVCHGNFGWPLSVWRTLELNLADSGPQFSKPRYPVNEELTQ